MVLKIFTAANPARLLLVDDHPMLRRGLADLLSLEKDVQVIAEANHGMEALDILNQEIVDLVILDHTMPILNGIETLKKIRELGIQTKVLLFTVSDNSKDVQDALHLGVDGYLLKDMEPEQIITDIRKILRGELVISPSLAPILAQAMRKPVKTDSSHELTEREIQVAKMIAQGMSNKMIGNKLGIAESTVKVHVKHILGKIDLRTRVEIAVWAVGHYQ
ncbi:two-component system response regulator NarL [Moraxella catarrhalis]|uniref:Nitrate/nitrite response regulator protein n=1 Tax=Moraxella catarrhalis TaxID=480 RepID=A0A198X2L7_MORCA|nr:two-component system response regulator NarL [Moraxella catarrhalis]MPW63850.1 two-component system response regulator NarL [Moraxella catarrhalis]MPW74975.1 two-component system response regulator NarL [Moraxella catarrhalis]MPX19003.1 two-component system response regulator NarL [Moraxella catarrhalis]MPX29821.1 two-component system response regulator NarL [Moraxella catarrhalis]OAV02664.1 Nitrate/nitrite response regulator protein [Moraxella catarrhalis]